MKIKNILISLALSLGVVLPLHAQGLASGKNCSTAEAVGYLGISGIDCNCTVSRPNSDYEWRFRTEPRITSLEMDSRAGTLLKIGDVITAVNGKPITTREGALELKTLKPGESVVLTVRRNGETLRYALTAESACPDDSRLFSLYAPGRAYPAPGAVAGVIPTPAPPSGMSGVAAPRGRLTPPPGVSVPKVTFGMGLSCSNCSMWFGEYGKAYFSRPPEIYSIERNGPADKAGLQRGDLITHVNGKAIDSDEGGKAFGSVRAGDVVKFTVVRNNDVKTYSVKASAREYPRPALAQSNRALERAQAQLERLQKSKDESVRRDVERVSAELDAARAEMNAASCAVPTPAPRASVTPLRTLRYTGTMGNADIEVRGGPASVSETPDEIVITTSGSVVRISKKK